MYSSDSADEVQDEVRCGECGSSGSYRSNQGSFSDSSCSNGVSGGEAHYLQKQSAAFQPPPPHSHSQSLQQQQQQQQQQ